MQRGGVSAEKRVWRPDGAQPNGADARGDSWGGGRAGERSPLTVLNGRRSMGCSSKHVGTGSRPS